jgi:probable HAF family extracellular repeat protein
MHSIHAPHRAALAIASLCAVFAAQAAGADKAPVTRYHVVAAGDGNTLVNAISGNGIMAGSDSTGAALFDRDLVATPLPAPGTVTGAVPMAVNNHGAAAGSGTAASGHQRAILWRKGRAINLGTLPGGKNEDTYAVALNASAEVVGFEGSDSTYARAFIWTAGSMTELPSLPGSLSTYATGINVAGHVAGYATIAGDQQLHATLVRDGVAIDLGTLGPGARAVANAINDDDVVVGGSSLGPLAEPRPPMHAFKWKDGVMTDLGTLTDGNAFGYAVNRKGTVVGASYFADSDDSVAFVDEGPKMVDLNKRLAADSTGWQLKLAVGIDDDGRIVGYGTLDGEYRSFLATPVK